MICVIISVSFVVVVVRLGIGMDPLPSLRVSKLRFRFLSIRELDSRRVVKVVV